MDRVEFWETNLGKQLEGTYNAEAGRIEPINAMQKLRSSTTNRKTMFGIDPAGPQEEQKEFEQIFRIRNLYAAMLRRAIDDLDYYKHHKPINYQTQIAAYNDARNAQSWLDDHVTTCAIPCKLVRELLGIEKSSIDAYLDRHDIRFKFDTKPPTPPGKAYKIRSITIATD